MSQGGPVPIHVKYLREIEPGLWWVSINGAEPEYLMSAEWMKRQPVPPMLDILNAKLPRSEAAELRRRFEQLAAMWESRADHDVKYAVDHVPEELRDGFLDGAANFRLRAADIRRILEEVLRNDLDPGVRAVHAPDAEAPD